MKGWTIIIVLLAIRDTAAFRFGDKFFNGGLKNTHHQLEENKVRVRGNRRNTIDHAVGVVRSSDVRLS